MNSNKTESSSHRRLLQLATEKMSSLSGKSLFSAFRSCIRDPIRRSCKGIPYWRSTFFGVSTGSGLLLSIDAILTAFCDWISRWMLSMLAAIEFAVRFSIEATFVEQLNNQSTVFFMMWRDGSWFGAFTADCQWLSLSSAVMVGQIVCGGKADLLVCGASWRPHNSDGMFRINRRDSCWLKKRGGSTRRSSSSLIADCWSNWRRLYWSLADCCGARNTLISTINLLSWRSSDPWFCQSQFHLVLAN